LTASGNVTVWRPISASATDAAGADRPTAAERLSQPPRCRRHHLYIVISIETITNFNQFLNRFSVGKFAVYMVLSYMLTITFYFSVYFNFS